MIIDTSAIMAILLEEPEQDELARKLGTASVRRVSAGTWIELTVVMTRRADARLLRGLEALREQFPFEIAPATTEQALIGAEAYRTYGHGAGHKARLNFGDCFAYALAEERNCPLLYVGNDFAQTDIVSAIASP